MGPLKSASIVSVMPPDESAHGSFSTVRRPVNVRNSSLRISTCQKIVASAAVRQHTCRGRPRNACTIRKDVCACSCRKLAFHRAFSFPRLAATMSHDPLNIFPYLKSAGMAFQNFLVADGGELQRFRAFGLPKVQANPLCWGRRAEVESQLAQILAGNPYDKRIFNGKAQGLGFRVHSGGPHNGDCTIL